MKRRTGTRRPIRQRDVERVLPLLRQALLVSRNDLAAVAEAMSQACYLEMMDDAAMGCPQERWWKTRARAARRLAYLFASKVYVKDTDGSQEGP